MESKKTNKNLVLIILFLILTGTPLAFYSTTLSMINTWIADETFTHGFLIFPITLWLIWQKKDLLREVHPQPESKVLILLFLFLIGWFLGQIAEVQLVQQLTMVFIINILVWLLLGRQILTLLIFPLLFLFFSVPLGEQLIPVLMDFTANFTVFMLRLTGIPVLQDGLYFSLPSGDWSVIEACSGVRYLIASFALGIIYAYISYTSLKKRLIFIIISIIVPIIANGFRAYGIVMLGHMSGMELATGVDHLIYGWIFFGFIIFILFLIGSKWWDPVRTVDQELQLFNVDKNSNQTNKSLYIIFLTATTLILTTFYFTDHIKEIDEKKTDNLSLDLPENFNAWQYDTERALDWLPIIKNPDILETKHYHFGTELVQLTVGYYQTQTQGSEAVSYKNRISSPRDGKWKQTATADLKEQSLYIKETSIRNGNIKILVWSWYRIGKIETPNVYIAKALSAYNIIVTKRTDATIITIATPLNEDINYSREQLRLFWSEAGSEVNQQLEKLAGTD